MSRSELLKIAEEERKTLQKAESVEKRLFLPETSVKYFFGGSCQDAIACLKEASTFVEGKQKAKMLEEVQALEKLDKLGYEEIVSAVLTGAIATLAFESIQTLDRWKKGAGTYNLRWYIDAKPELKSELEANVKNPLIVQYIFILSENLFELILIAGPQKPLHPLVGTVRKLNLHWG